MEWPKLILLLNFVCFVAVFLLTIPMNDNSRTYCVADGTPNPNGLGVGLARSIYTFSPSTLFSVNIAFGHYTFPAAKFIDVVWDVVVGRGGQVLMAYVSAKVFTRSLLHSMEERAVSYSLFSSIAFQPISMEGIITLCRERFGKGLHGKLRFVGITIAAFYIVCFPTLMSATTGYSTGWIPYVSTFNGTMVRLSEFDAVQYTIADGARIGLKDVALVYAKTNFVGETPSYYDINLLGAVDACKSMP
jgi:hypothetical protein